MSSPDWEGINKAVDRITRAWPILAPFVAILENWKAWAIAFGMYGFLRREEIIAALDVLTGVVK